MGRDYIVREGRPRRAGLLDDIRGLCVILMLVYHGLYDLVYLFGVDFPAYQGPFFNGMQAFIAWNFIFISGIACRYSRSNLRRGLITLGLGVGVSLTTYFFMPGQMIWFGILHFLGTAMILFGLLERTLDRLPVGVGILLSLALFAFTFRLPQGAVGIPGILNIPLPAVLYRLRWLLPIGFGGSGSDYFPLLPWSFLYFAGAYLGRVFASERMPAWCYRSHLPPLAKIGRRTIVIYILHQPVLYGVLWLVFRFITG